MGVLSAVAPFVSHSADPATYPAAGVIDVVMFGVIGFLFWGTSLNLLVAIPKGSRQVDRRE